MTDPSPTLAVVLDPMTRAQAAAALRAWVDDAWRHGIRPTPGIKALADLLAASTGPERPSVDPVPRSRNGVGMPPLLTYPEAAAALSVGERTVRRMVSDGRLRAVPLGRARRIPATEIDRIAKGAEHEN